MALSVRSFFSPAQPWATLFHLPDPPIAMQSITRDAPFSQAAMASIVRSSIPIILPSLLARPSSGVG